MFARTAGKLAAVMVSAWLLSGCGVQRMQLGEQEVKADWGTILSLASQEVEAVERGIPGDKGAKTALKLEEAKTALRSGMNKWEEIPSKAEVEEGSIAVSLASDAVKDRLAEAKSEGLVGVEAVEAEVDRLRELGRVARDRYAISARTYNDILRMYPSKWTAKVLMKQPAVSFEDAEKMSGEVNSQSMLDKLGVATEH